MREDCGATPLPVAWPEDAWRAPRCMEAKDHVRPGVRSIFFANEPLRGRETRVFGFMGMPYLAGERQCPGMVLVHGGGGTAYDEWVRLWNQRGYAAIAVDVCGGRPRQDAVGHAGPHARDEFSGPEGWNASFRQVRGPVDEHWQYHAVCALLRAHALLAAQPGVDPERIGITGISWGGYLTCLLAGVDPRYAAAVPVYGCGFLRDNSAWRDQGFDGVEPELVQRWDELWDPRHYLSRARAPMLWVSGSNDFAYPLDSLQKSYRAAAGPVQLAIEIERPHSHADGWNPPEIAVFMDALARGGAPLPCVRESKVADGHLQVRFSSPRPVMRAELCYTRVTGQWQDRRFNRLPADIDGEYAQAEIPAATTVAFLNIYDDRGCVASSPHVLLP